MQTTKITDIKKTKQGRFALFCAMGFLFSVPGEVLLQQKVEIGSELTGEEIEGLKRNSDLRNAKDKALRYLSLRAYGSAELCAKLKRSFDEHTAAAAVAAMGELGLIDDEAFARNRGAYYINTAGKSLFEAGQKLRALGLEKDEIQAALAPFEGGQVQAATALLEKHYLPKLKKGEIAKVKAALGRKGFTYQDIKQALGTVLAHLNIDIPDDDGNIFDIEGEGGCFETP